MGTEGLLRYCLLVASFYSLNSGQVNIWILKQFGILGLGGIETVWDFWVGVLEQFATYKDFGTVWDFWVSGYQNSLVNKMILRQFE